MYNFQPVLKRIAIAGIFSLIFALFIYLLYKPVLHIQKPLVVTSKSAFAAESNLESILKKEGIRRSDIVDAIKAFKMVFNPLCIKAGDHYEIKKTTDNKLIEFTYLRSPFEKYQVKKTDDARFVCEKITLPVEVKIVKSSGVVSSSLYESMLSNNLPPELILNFADIFSWQVDFLTETRTGDVYELVYEQITHNKENVGFGKIIAARYSGKSAGRHVGIYFESNGQKGYYDLEGNDLRRFFLRAPLNFRRISSHFTHRRFHPILRRFMPHYGIDYAAPYGTPVVSVGDGVVKFCSWKGGLGKTVIIRHPNGYETMYGHLSRFAKGLRIGKKVKQGEVIGYVGSTGLSTGPHLDFRVLKDGKYKNFLSLKFPSYKKLKGELLEEYKVVRDKALAMLDSY